VTAEVICASRRVGREAMHIRELGKVTVAWSC